MAKSIWMGYLSGYKTNQLASVLAMETFVYLSFGYSILIEYSGWEFVVGEVFVTVCHFHARKWTFSTLHCVSSQWPEWNTITWRLEDWKIEASRLKFIPMIFKMMQHMQSTSCMLLITLIDSKFASMEISDRKCGCQLAFWSTWFNLELVRPWKIDDRFFCTRFNGDNQYVTDAARTHTHHHH